jgi:hypothetical protein
MLIFDNFPECQIEMMGGIYWCFSGVDHHNRLFAKACPEPDLRYISNSTAFDSSEKAR